MNPYATYKKQSVETMTPIEMVVKGYDECERQLNRAICFIENKDFYEAHVALDKASELVNAFRASLDMSAGEMSNNLDSLYEYFYRQIIAADTKKDVAIIEDVLPQIGELKDAFVQISVMPRDNLMRSSILAGTEG